MCVRSPQAVGCEIMSLAVPLRWGIVRLQHKPPATSRKGTGVRHCSADPPSQGDPISIGKGPTGHLRGQSTAKLSSPTKVPARHTQDNCTPNPTSRAPRLETLHQRRAQRGDEKSPHLISELEAPRPQSPTGRLQRPSIEERRSPVKFSPLQPPLHSTVFACIHGKACAQ